MMYEDKEKMSKEDYELCRFIDSAVSSSIVEQGTYKQDNKKWFDDYNCDLYGDEEEGLSAYVSPDVRDTVDSDLVSLARVFLGGGAPVEFKPLKGSPEAIKEADDINKYVNFIIETVPNSYKVQIDALKEILIQSCGYVEYGIREAESVETKKFEDLDRLSFELKLEELKKEKDVVDVKIEQEIDNGFETFDFEVSLIKERKEFFINNVPWENMIIPNGIQTKNESLVFGKKFTKRRGELVKEGYSKELVKSIPTNKNTSSQEVKVDRHQDQGGQTDQTSLTWANEEVSGVDVYCMFDYNGDDISERRHVIKCGDIILENEPMDHIPYAGCSAIQMPHNIIGRSRAQLTSSDQRLNSVLTRNLLDNQTQVNLGRVYIDDKNVNMDDQMTAFKNGVIRVEGQPAASVMPEPVMYNGDKTLQVIQYMDSKQSKATGNMLSNQALTSDQLNQETATRFNGMKDSGTGKIELICRNISEIFYRDLYEGIAWMARHYQDSELEMYVLGNELTVNPSTWAHEHNVVSMVGTGAGDETKAIETLSGILKVQKQEQANGSPLVDNEKIYTTLKHILRASGINGIQNFFNDPNKPEQLVIAQNEQMQQTIQQMQMQLEQLTQNDPLSQAEKIRAEATLLVAQSRKQEADQKDLLKAAEMQQDMQQFMLTMRANQEKLDSEQIIKLTELELKYGQNVLGAIV